jgi:putative peptide zinc metalloprotease protein
MKKEVKLKFRPDIVRHWFDERGGGRSLVLEDPVANRFFRISPYELELLKVLDGTRSLTEAIERLRLHGRHFTVEHATRLVEQFARAGLLLGTQYGSSKYQAFLKNRMASVAKQRSLTRLYFLFIPILNPDRFLDRTLWLWRLLVNRFTAALFALLVPGAIYLLISGVSRIAGQFSFFFNLQNLLVLWIALAVMKLVHEFSHAYTAKGLGLRVPEMGIAFLIFFPCLYCNTTTAWQLADRKQRMSIAAAGVISEAVVAVIATYIWYFSKPGLVNSVAFFLMAVSLISSLLFNGNPLLKFDGYFILTDWLRMPNLQQRAFGRIRYLFFNKVLGMEAVQVGRTEFKERLIQITYGVSAFIYRIFLYTGIVIGVYYRFDKTVGAILGLLAFLLFVARPIVMGGANLVKNRSELGFRPRGLLVFALILGWSDLPAHAAVVPKLNLSVLRRVFSSASDRRTKRSAGKQGSRQARGRGHRGRDGIPVGSGNPQIRPGGPGDGSGSSEATDCDDRGHGTGAFESSYEVYRAFAERRRDQADQGRP